MKGFIPWKHILDEGLEKYNYIKVFMYILQVISG